MAAMEHIMLSYNWDHQGVIKRVHSSLVRRGYTTWIDIEKMQGSTVEAMAGAVENAAVMCYGISRAYKESTNCRMEAQYAHQREKDLVPLMVEEGYRADGWLGMLLGMRLWYSFCGRVLESEADFEGKMEELCRELGDRGQQQDTQACARSSDQAFARQALPGGSVLATLRMGDRHSADLLEALLERVLRSLQVACLSTPRKQRRELRQTCERLEHMLECVEDVGVGWLASCGEAQLVALGDAIVDALEASTTDGADDGDATGAASLRALNTLVDMLQSALPATDMQPAFARDVAGFWLDA
jgi:hypothetical protein